MAQVKQFKFVTDFQCLADKCEDHCCGTWRVSINDATREMYLEKAPELSEYVEEDDRGYKITKDPETNCCSHLVDGLCRIHKSYKEDFLPDTCSFYPRTFREIDDETIVTATTSCPEIARLVVEMDDPFVLEDQEVAKFPENVGDYADEDADETLYVLQRFIQESQREDLHAEAALTRIISACKILDTYQPDYWSKIVDNVFDMVQYSTPEQTDENTRMFDIVRYFVEISRNKPARWLAMFEQVESVFRVHIPKDQYQEDFDEDPLKVETLLNTDLIEKLYNNEVSLDKMNRVLRRFLGAELVRNIFPYAGAQGSIYEKIVPIVMSFCFLRIALIAYSDEDGTFPSKEKVVTIIQTLSRGTNHLSVDVLEFFKDKGIYDEGSLYQIINNP